MSWLLFALLNVLGAGTAIFIAKTKLNKNIPYAGVMFVSLFVAALGYIPFLIPQLQHNPTLFTHPVGYIYFFIALAVTICGFYFYTKALSMGDLSVLGPLDATRPFFVVIFSIFLLHQNPTTFLLLGIVFVVGGAMVLTLKKKFLETIEHIRNSKEILYILLATIIFALGSIFDKKTLMYTQPIIYSFLILLGVSLFFGIQYLSSSKKVSTKVLFSPILIGSGFLWTIAYIGNMYALRIATPNVVMPVLMTRSLYLSLLGFLFLGEKGYVRKIIAAVLMLIGVFFITR